MRTHIVLILLGLQPLAAVAQTPTVIARNGAFGSSEAIFISAGEGGKGGNVGEAGKGVPQARSTIASPDARASHPLRDDRGELTAAMRTLLLANCPNDMPEADWLKLMEQPVNRTLFPLRITQAMLDTIDAEKLDLRFRYVLDANAGPSIR